jgi:tRNA dimethylallyltransferase
VKPLVLAGVTASGKSTLAVTIAQEFGAAIVSMDAMQVYRGMDIGTAKLPPHERGGVVHHAIDIRDPDEAFTARDWVDLAEAVAQPVVLVGGTTFYLRAYLRGLVETPPVDPALRAELEALPDPWSRLREIDPLLAARLHPNDRVRVIRGLEVHALGGRPLGELHAADVGQERDVELLWIDHPGAYARVDARVLAMMSAGYLDEVSSLLGHGYGRDCKPMKSLGYAHLAAHLAGELELDEAVRRTQRDTRTLARKQRMFARARAWAATSAEDLDVARRAAERAFAGRRR